MAGFLVLLVLVGAFVIIGAALTKLMWLWKPPLGRRIVQGCGLLTAGLFVYSCGSLSGAWFYVSRSEAEEEFEEVLGFDVPHVERVSDARDLGWTLTDGPHYGYTAVFSAGDFEAFMVGWRGLTDSTAITMHDSAETVTYEFVVLTDQRAVRYFHADE